MALLVCVKLFARFKAELLYKLKDAAYILGFCASAGAPVLSCWGWGWVAEMGGRIAWRAHPLEKSAFNIKDISIHRLYPSAKVGVRWWGSGSVMGHFGGDVFLPKQVRFRI
jgi:hypothetical protein